MHSIFFHALLLVVPTTIFFSFFAALPPVASAENNRSSSLQGTTRQPPVVVRGRRRGRTANRAEVKVGADEDEDVHLLLARSIQKRLMKTSPDKNNDQKNNCYNLDSISKALRSIASTQAALKKIDGTAHEMYQRTHKSSTTLDGDDDDVDDDKWGDDGEEDDGETGNNGEQVRGRSSSSSSSSKEKKKIGGLKVAGRMSRNAARVGCIADALFAAELCELIHEHYSPSPHSCDANYVGEENSNSLPTHDNYYDDDEGTLAPWTGRKVVLNTTIYSDEDDDADDASDQNHRLAISILVIYEHDYNGGAGRNHGGVDDLLSYAKEELEEKEDDDDDDLPATHSTSQNNTTDDIAFPRGRFLVVLADHYFEATHHKTSSKKESSRAASLSPYRSSNLPSIISILDKPPQRLRLQSKRSVKMEGSSASVCGPLYDIARKVVETILPVLDMGNHDTISKGVSDRNEADNEKVDERDQNVHALNMSNSQSNKAAVHFVGYSLAGGVAAVSACIMDGTLPLLQHKTSDKKRQHHLSVAGSGFARTSALCLGPPPCLSSNLQSDFITSVIHGDDIVCRTTQGTINHLCDRVRRAGKGGILGRSVGWMGDAVSMTVSGLKGSSSNNDKKETTLTVPGKVYLVRPRRIGGGSSSIHEIGGRGSRESLRAALLWQLNDVLVSKSLWSHHRLDAYIHSLDKVRLKGFADNPSF